MCILMNVMHEIKLKITYYVNSFDMINRLQSEQVSLLKKKRRHLCFNCFCFYLLKNVVEHASDRYTGYPI